MAQKNRAVVTGAGSGIGQATKELLESRGWLVLGIDIRNGDVDADLSGPEGRTEAIEAVTAWADQEAIDSLISCAGISALDEPKVTSVNFFGTTAVFDGLRSLLARSQAPRAVAVSSLGALFGTDKGIVDACLANDEGRALAASRQAIASDPTRPICYTSSKNALSRWIRRTAIAKEWGGSRILLNAVAPGVVRTPMTADLLRQPQLRDQREVGTFPDAVLDVAEPRDIALLLAFLGGPENRYVTGQTILSDGGAEANTWTDRWF